MHDNVSVVDRFRFWFSSRNSFQGAKSIAIKLILFLDQISGGGEGAEVSEGAPPVEESQASDSVM